jgi:hypothetical protein
MVNNAIVLSFHLSFLLVSSLDCLFVFVFFVFFFPYDVEQTSKQVTGLIPIPIADVT